MSIYLRNLNEFTADKFFNNFCLAPCLECCCSSNWKSCVSLKQTRGFFWHILYDTPVPNILCLHGSTGQSYAGTQILIPKLGNHRDDFDQTWNQELLPKGHPPCKTASWCEDLGGVGEYPVCHSLFGFFVFLFGFLVMCTGCTSGPILTIYTSCNVFPCDDVPFESCIDTAPHLVVQIAQKPQFWGRE